jgi:hypothetical protein
MQKASVSLSVLNQLPDFIKENSPLFETFLSQYYRSQEKVSAPIGIINNLTDYFNVSKYDLTKLDGNTVLINNITDTETNIEAENTDGFVDTNGTILINNEVIYYESLKKSPNVILSSGISYQEFDKKLVELFNLYLLFNGTRTSFPLRLNNAPVFPISPDHLLVKVFNEYLRPGIDFILLADQIVFTNPPRAFDPVNLSDSSNDVQIRYLKGFSENTIDVMDTMAPSSIGQPPKYIFKLKKTNQAYFPPSTVLTVVIVDEELKVPFVDYSVFEDSIIFKVAPTQSIYVAYINAAISAVGSGAQAYSVVNDIGEISKIIVKDGGSGYTLDNTPKVTISGSEGQNATARALVGGLRSITLIESGTGYSQSNPPLVIITPPTQTGSVAALASATVNATGGISAITLDSSGSGYDFIPRIQFVNPTGSQLGVPVVSNGVIQSIPVLDGGIGYTTPPQIYIDPSPSEIGIQALAQAVLDSDGSIASIQIITGGTGYSSVNLPRTRVIEPTGAQILDVGVDDFGRVISIELLTGGFGYDDVPSVYIVDDRKDNVGNPIGGSGAKAVATIFNGQIIDINITDFGTGYSTEYPPKVYISSPPGAKASCEIGADEVTGFELVNLGSNYVKSQFIGCARGVSGIVEYDSNNNIVFKDESQSIAAIHPSGSIVKSVDSVFLKKILDRIVEQYLPGLPDLDTNTLNIANVISTIKDFYASKGTIYSIKYLFKLLYGASVDVNYPKDQMIKPSASTWSVDTILRARIISGDPINLKDSVLEQVADAVDLNVQTAKALVENYTAIQTSDFDVYELIVSEETIEGNFIIPYSSRLIESLDPDSLIIDVDSTIGWPERNGEVVIVDEIIRYKEKTLTQFIECTRGINGTTAQSWDAGTICTSNFYIYANRGTSREVVLSILGIVDANKTTLLDDGSYYLSGDKLSISKLGTDDSSKLVTSWLYNVKKLLRVESIIFGGVNDQTATVTCLDPHGLLVGDQVTVYGANPIVYNGSFFVSARESATVFKYTLPQSAVLNPQGNILISIDLNKGKSDSSSINTAISKFPSNIQNAFLNNTEVYVAASGIPNYKIGPFLGTALLPGNQRKLYKFPRIPNTISLKTTTIPGPIGSFVNGVSIWNYKSEQTYKFGPVININITNAGKLYDAAVPPILSFSGGGGTGAEAEVVIDGSVIDIEVLTGGSGYTSSPLVSIYGSNGIGASATAIITNGIVSRVLVNTSGSGYTSEPIVTITGGGGTAATAKAVIRGPIKDVNILNSGTSYTSPPSIRLSSGSGAAAQAYVSNGRISSIAIISAGSGYTTAPKVIITGDGFGAVAKAVISTEGADAGRVTSILILNKGIGYTSGTTQIRLESIGEGAEFSSEIYEWTFNLNEETAFDYANGSIFEGFNNQYGGEYAHISNPKQLRYVLGDNLDLVNGELVERESVVHSPILGWSFDGHPIYGPYGLNDPTLLSSNVVPIRSSYRLRTNLVYDVNTNPNPYRIEGPSLVDYPAGTFVEDYVYSFNSLAIYLDEYNGRFTKTPEFPDGVYAYFVTLDSAGNSEYPYIMGPKFYSVPENWNLTQFATQSFIPTGVVRYRTPFENVDIDVERTPNESTNALTLENGDLLLFDIEDENKDGVITSDEINDPNIMFEENKLELFDYFPKINISSKVDIEVDTTTKFEDAKVTGFLIENSGQNYQVNDRLVFDDFGSEGYGASARVSEISGETITSYNYEYNSTLDIFKGVIQTANPHNLVVGDRVNVNTVPLMEPSSKTIYVRTIRGLEKITIDQEGIGYDPENPPSIQIESATGQYASLVPVVSSSGIIDEVLIKNSGDGYTQDPIIRIEHPQTRKKADYFYSTHSEDVNLTISAAVVSESDKSIYIVGRSKTTDNNNHGFIQKLNAEGSVIWSKSLSSTQPGSGSRYCEFTTLYKDGSDIYVVGITRPNQSLYDAFNPDVVMAKYTENVGGTSASLIWQREMAGISGITRSDYATGISKVGDNFIICGYTNTNTTSVFDGFLIYINSSGDVATKRKITSNTLSEKFYQVKTDSQNNIFVIGHTGSNSILLSKLYVASNRLLVSWTKQISLSSYKFDNISFDIDEYDQLYVVASAEVISTGSRNRIHVVRLSNSGNILKNNVYTVSGGTVTPGKCSIDVFGDINVSYSIVETDLSKTVGVLKLDYNGTILKSTKLSSGNLIRGFETSLCVSDVSGDPLVFGQVYENRTQFLFNAESSYDDVTGRVSDLTTTGTVTVVTDPKYGTNAYNIALLGRMRATTSVTSSSWTLEGWFKYTSATTSKILNEITVTDGANSIIVQINSATGSNYGKLRTDLNGAAGTWSTQTDVATLMNAGYVHIALTKSFANSVATYTVYVNGTQYSQRTSSVNINPAQIDFGSTTGTASNPTRVDDIRLSNYVVSYSGSAPTSAYAVVDYGQASGFIFKTDKNADTERLGTITLTDHGYTISRTTSSSVSSSIDSSSVVSNYILGSEGLQILDFNYAISALTQDFGIPSVVSDLWSSRTATIPTVGGSKIKVTANALDKFFFNSFTTNKVDNVRKLNLNQSFDLNVGTTLILKNNVGSTIASAKILEKNLTDNYVLVSDLTGTFTTNTGQLSTSDEFINEIEAYSFANVVNTTPGTFDISIPIGIEAKFKPYSDEDYLVRIDAVLTGSNYVVGSVVTLSSSNFSFNSTYSSVIVSGLAAVTQISMVTNLTKILQVDSIDNTDLVFVRTTTSHYLDDSSIVYVTTSPTYTPLTGTFDVYSVLSKKEFIVKLREVANSFLTTQTVTIFVKTPIFKFIYGQQYTFDTSHTSMQGHYLSFYRDNLYKIEYTFKNIVRKGTPGFDEPGNSPFISFKVTEDAANISYYADPADLSSDGPVTNTSYIDVQPSPYIGSFIITDLAGGTVTSGPNRFKFALAFEPEKVATASSSSYSTTSVKAVGSISRIRLINGGGFYKKLPVITDISSARKIERVDIVEPGTEYEAGEYFGVPILGDGTGGKVSILVDGSTDPAGQIVEVTVTDPGKGYTTAYIDVDAIDGILGPGLDGSGAVLEVIIPPKGTGASIFAKGTNVGKIKKLKNNNFGFNYTHDYTLRPEITFPVNLQLVNTSILSSIKVIDPGTGYTTPPEIIIEGGGGTGAIAQAILKNGRISDIIVKNAGSGYSTAPAVTLKSSFTYVVNLDLGLFQFSFPHGIQNGAELSFTVQDIGEGASFPLTSFGFIDPDQVYYAISGTSAGLEDDQLRIALTPQDAISGNYISFANAGTGRQIALTSSFGGSAESVVETGRFLSGEFVFQGETLGTATATGYVSTNDGWQIGPRVLKLTSVDGVFEVGQQVNGIVSKASGTITQISIAKGVLEVNSITNTVGKFLDDIGKPSEIVQKIQDSYLYQAFSYNVKSPVPIEGWRETLINTTHPAGFKVFGEIDISGGGKGLTDKTDFELTKSVNLIESSVVANIDNFALVQPIYQDFDNTQVLFRTKRLTSSEEILTSVVQRLDDISPLFDGERTSFPLTIDGVIAIANTSQFMIVINGITQAPGTSFIVQQGNIIFFEPPAAPTKISYAELSLLFEETYVFTISDLSGILPELGNTIRGLTSNATATIISSTTSELRLFNITGTFQNDEVLISTATGLNCSLVSQVEVQNDNLFEFGEKITNLSGKTAVVEEINLDNNLNAITNNIVISKSSGTYDSPSGLLQLQLNNFIVSAKSGVVAKITGISPYQDPQTGTFVSSISISDPSSFFGLLFNRIVNPQNPNTIVDDLSKSLVEVNDLTETDIKVESNFVAFEDVTNIILDFNYNSGSLQSNDLVQNISVDYINETGDFTASEDISSRKLSYHTLAGGNFQIGNTITGSLSGVTATIIGINYALKTLYLGQKSGSYTLEETISNGSGVTAKVSNYIQTSFVANQINTTTNIILTGQFDDGARHRFRDAANLLRLNSTYIVDESAGRLKNRYSDLNIPGDTSNSLDGTNRCKLDLSLLLNAVAEDLENGGNYNTVTAARFYIDANGGLNFIRLQALQSLYAHTQMSLLCQSAVDGSLSYTPSYTNQIPVPPTDIIVDGGGCANVKSAIDTLWVTINDIIAPNGQVYRDAGDLLWFNRNFIAQESTGYIESYFTYTLNNVIYSAFSYPDGSPTTCERDITDYIIPSIITDLITGGNSNTVAAMEYYIGNGDIQYVKDELLATVIALEKANELCQYAVDNWIVSGTTEYQVSYGATASKYKDLTILPDTGEYGGNCERIKAAIDTLFNIAIGILIPERNTYYGRYYDASNLINSNKQLIAQVAVGRMLANYPGFTVPNGNQNCIDDVVTILEAIVYDLRNGGNARIFDYSKVYTVNPVLSGEQTESNYAFNQARDMAIQAMRNETITIGGYSALSQVKDLTIIVDPISPTCANVASSITTLFSILTTAITNGNMSHVTRQSDSDANNLYRNAAKLLLFNKEYIKVEALQRTLNNYPTFTVPGGNAKCLRDIGYIIDAIVYDLLTDGNKGILNATLSYIDAATGTVISLQGELVQSIYAYTQVKALMKQAIAETLSSPSSAAGQYAYTDAGISITGSNLTSLETFIDDGMAILLGTLNNSDYIENNSIIGSNSITVPTKTYPTRNPISPLSGQIVVGDYVYGATSQNNAEIEQIIFNRGRVKDIMKRFEISYDEETEVFTLGDELTIPGQTANTCVIESVENGEFVSYIDVKITGGSFAVSNTLINDAGFTATIDSIENRIQLINLIGSFDSGQYIKGLYSNASLTSTNFEYNISPVLSNTGGKLTLETESLQGEFIVTRKVYSSISSQYIDVIQEGSTGVDIGDIVQSQSIYKLTISYDSDENTFPIGDTVLNSTNFANSSYILGYDILTSSTAYLYVGNIQGSVYSNGQILYHYDNPTDQFPNGIGTITNVDIISSEGYATVQKVAYIGNYTRLYLTNVVGVINQYAQLISNNDYRSAIVTSVPIVGRISRSFLGFDGQQTEFKLTSNNGDQFFPDSDGHVLVFVNGILQPPIASYTVFSDTIEFAEAPDLGASFHAVYIGKLRQLDDISFEFDSLRSSFNLKLNEVFYSLTITSGVSSTTIKPENNIIVSLNGVVQEPGVAFELVGSRIIFAEVPRAGSTFVAFSYIGSDADVIAAEIIPPIESGDVLEIEGEDQDRTVALIESSNSLVTFDYLGSVLGRNAEALSNLITGRVSKLQLTSSGDGYTSRPTVSFDSSTGFDAQAKALIGVSRVDVVDRGSGYAYAEVEVITELGSVTGFTKVNSDGRWTDLLDNYSIPGTGIIVTIVWPGAGTPEIFVIDGGDDDYYVGQTFTIPGNLISHTGGGNMIIEVTSISV